MSRGIDEAASVVLRSIPAGTVALRDDRKQLEWSVDVSPFQLAAYPVTQELYRAVTQDAPSAVAGAQNPVDSVSWFDAVRFCNLLSVSVGRAAYYAIDGTHCEIPDATADGYRLPSDAEWEYACKAGNPAPRYGQLTQIAWFAANSRDRTQPVGMKQPNAWGLYDMLGNVWEWCWDLYDAEVYGPYRVFRGGGWSDAERGCLATNRRRSHPDFRIDDLGFRIACNGYPA